MTERLPAPQINGRIQRKTPTFARPSISVGGGSEEPRRAWRQVAVTAVQPGDIIPGIGAVRGIEQRSSVTTVTVPADGYCEDCYSPAVVDEVVLVWQFTFTGGTDDHPVKASYEGTNTVYAFTAAL